MITFVRNNPWTAAFILVLVIVEFLSAKLFSLLIFIACLGLIAFFRSKNLKILIITILAIIFLITPVPNTLVDLKNSIAGASELAEITAPNTGLEVLPKPVQQMLIMLNENHIPDYGLSERMVTDPEIYQRVVEAAWPVNYIEQSHYIFRYEDEARPFKSCKILDHQKGIYLDSCP